MQGVILEGEEVREAAGSQAMLGLRAIVGLGLLLWGKWEPLQSFG